MSLSSSASYPMVVNSEYSPTSDIFDYPAAFDKAYLADAYTTRPDYSFDVFLDNSSFFDQPVDSIERSSNVTSNQFFVNAPPTASTTSPTDINAWSHTNQPPFGRIGNVIEAFAPSPTFNNPSTSDSFHVSDATPRDSSPTPSLCGDGPQAQRHSSASLSPRSVKRETPQWDEELTPKRPRKKRGRPRLDRTSTDSTASTTAGSTKARTAQRLPHNQVERKYREGLNAELERLRRAVPTLIQQDSKDLTGPPKPSKATILASAIDYIKKVEKERDALRNENDVLRGLKSAGSRNR